MNRKKILSCLILLTVAFSCLADSADAFFVPKKTEVVFWHVNEKGYRNNVIQHAVNTFNSTIGEEKGITIIAEYKGSTSKLHKALQEAAAAGEALPNVVTFDSTQQGQLIDEGLLVDMMPYAEKNNYDLSNLNDIYLQGYGNTEGKLHGVPYSRAGYLLFYNKTLADEKGLRPASDMGGGLSAFCRALHTVDSVTGEVLVQGLEMNSNFYYYQSAQVYQLGSSFIAEDGNSIVCVEDGTLKRIFEDWNSFAKEGWFNVRSNSETLESFFAGEVGAFVQFSSAFISTSANAQEANIEVGVLPFPSYGTEFSRVGGDNVGIVGLTNSNEEIEAAWLFVEHLLSDDVVVYNATEAARIPTTHSSVMDPVLLADFEAHPERKLAYEQANNGGCFEDSYHVLMPDVITRFNAALGGLLDGTYADADAALAHIKEAISAP